MRFYTSKPKIKNLRFLNVYGQSPSVPDEHRNLDLIAEWISTVMPSAAGEVTWKFNARCGCACGCSPGVSFYVNVENLNDYQIDQFKWFMGLDGWKVRPSPNDVYVDSNRDEGTDDTLARSFSERKAQLGL